MNTDKRGSDLKRTMSKADENLTSEEISYTKSSTQADKSKLSIAYRFALLIIVGFFGLFVAVALPDLDLIARPSILNACVELLKTVGATAIAVAVLNVWLESRDSTRFFEERIRTVLLEGAYIDSLSKAAAEELHTKLMKRRYPSVELHDKSSLFYHLDRKSVRSFLSATRERIEWTLNVKKSNDNWLINETFTYLCHPDQEDKLVQLHVHWIADEANTVEDVCVVLDYHDGDVSSKKSHTLISSKDDNYLERLSAGERIPDYIRKCSYVKAIITSRYKMPSGRFGLCATMLPTKGFILHINYPPEFRIISDFAIDDFQILGKVDYPGTFQLSHDGWMLPDNCFVWEILEQKRLPDLSNEGHI